jgi:hypothetical protein
MTRTSKIRIALPDSISTVNWMEGLKLLTLGHEARPQMCHQRNGATTMVYVVPSLVFRIPDDG